jgi:excisionase family DNA binding protein
MEVDQLLTTAEAAAFLNTPLATLRWWRHQGTGPKAFKLGPRKVMYKESDVRAWIEAHYNADPVPAG